jgi:hypothetical protein
MFMNAHPRPVVPTTPANVPDPVLQAGLAELFQLGLEVARVLSRLAEVEGRAIAALAEEAAETTRHAFVQQTSWADAVHAGHKMDTSEAAREAIAARMASVTHSFDLAARAVRRTAALQARLAEGRPWLMRAAGRGQEREEAAGGQPRQPANDAERAERWDDPEWGDEIAGRSDEEVVRDICRDLRVAGAGVGANANEPETAGGASLPGVIRALCARAAAPVVPGGGPTVVRPGSAPDDPRDLLPEPDT